MCSVAFCQLLFTALMNEWMTKSATVQPVRCWLLFTDASTATSMALHPTEPQHISDLDACRRLRSSSRSVLVTSRTFHVIIGDYAFPVAAASVWQSARPASQFEHRCHCQFYAVDWRPSFLLGRTAHCNYANVTLQFCSDYCMLILFV